MKEQAVALQLSSFDSDTAWDLGTTIRNLARSHTQAGELEPMYISITHANSDSHCSALHRALASSRTKYCGLRLLEMLSSDGKFPLHRYITACTAVGNSTYRSPGGPVIAIAAVVGRSG
jgi:hypothetical protein